MISILTAWRAYAILGVVVLLVGTNTYTALKGYSLGKQAGASQVVEKINKENENAGSAAEKWRADYRRCVDAGGVYNFETGACDQ